MHAMCTNVVVFLLICAVSVTGCVSAPVKKDAFQRAKEVAGPVPGIAATQVSFSRQGRIQAGCGRRSNYNHRVAQLQLRLPHWPLGQARLPFNGDTPSGQSSYGVERPVFFGYFFIKSFQNLLLQCLKVSALQVSCSISVSFFPDNVPQSHQFTKACRTGKSLTSIVISVRNL
jgi:hypothetical protein